MSATITVEDDRLAGLRAAYASLALQLEDGADVIDEVREVEAAINEIHKGAERAAAAAEARRQREEQVKSEAEAKEREEAQAQLEALLSTRDKAAKDVDAGLSALLRAVERYGKAATELHVVADRAGSKIPNSTKWCTRYIENVLAKALPQTDIRNQWHVEKFLDGGGPATFAEVNEKFKVTGDPRIKAVDQ